MQLPRPNRTPPLFHDDYEVRVPKRPTGYAAQLWSSARAWEAAVELPLSPARVVLSCPCSPGYWEVGVHPAAPAARRATLAFAQADPVPGSGAWRPPRTDHRRSEYKGVRRVKGFSWQARPWLGGGLGNLNLGLFSEQSDWGESAEWAAGRAARQFLRRWTRGRTVAEVVAELQHAKLVPEGVSPPRRLANKKPPGARANGPREYAGERRGREGGRRERRRDRERYPVTLLSCAAA